MTNTTSKMTLAKAIYNEVYSSDEAKPRAKVIERLMEELGMSKAGASTYHQNIRNSVVNGKSLYEYNKYKAKPKAEKEEVYIPQYRWLVLKDKVVVDSQPTRAKAQAQAKKIGGKWGDANK